MAEQIRSIVDPEIILFSINRFEEITSERIDLCPQNEFLQVSCKKIPCGTQFKPHKHLTLHRATDNTHEAWIVLDGEIEATFYDIDDSVIRVTILKTGDCAVVFRAGHSFKVLKDNTILYEVKNGPYYGQEKDKKFI